MHFFSSLVVLALAGLGAVAGSQASNSSLEARIIRGRWSQAYETRFFCGIHRYNQYNELEYACGASLIAEQTLLTSASCLQPGVNYVAQCGTKLLLASPFPFSPIETVLRHPDYEKTSGDVISNNIALAYLKDKVQCGRRIKFVELQTDMTFDTQNIRVWGYGTDEFPTGNDPIIPTYNVKDIDSQVLDNDSCRKFFRVTMMYSDVPEGTFCGSPKDPLASQCQFDQGGPVLDTTTGRQVGFVSYVSKYCAIERPGIYTSVRTFLPWIIDNMRPKNFPSQFN